MKKSRLLSLLLVALFVVGFLFFGVSSVSAALIINEFSPSSTTAWVELLNTSQTSSQDLSSWSIQNGGGTTLKGLSGNAPRNGFLTFEFSSSLLNGGGDCLLLADPTDTTIYQVAYGAGDCPGSGEPTLSGIPSSGQSGALISNSWAIDDTPSRGWCNDSTGGCPTIATIVSEINSAGVKTNLDSQLDYSRTSGLYFQKSETNDPDGTPMGKITFLSEMNFTDQDALSFLQTLGSKIDMSTKGRIGLDAALITSLASTNATLTMYGLGLANPKVLVGGADDTSGVVSGISYSGGTLTFTAAHFTTFTAVETSGSSGSSNSGSCSGPCLPSCNDPAPTTAPNLFQIDVAGTSANLYFAKLNGNVTGYGISFGLNKDANQYADLFSYSGPLWIINRNVSYLSPNTVYYFKVRAVNGCNAGEWSNVMKITTAEKGNTSKVVYHKNLPSQTPNTVTSKKTVVAPNTSENTQTPAIIQPTLQQPTVSTVGAPAVKSAPATGGGFWNAIASFFKGLFGR